MSTEKETELEQNKLDEPKSSNKLEERDYDDWRRVRSAIEHENNLVNYRLSWLGALQGLLFAAFGVILNALVSEKRYALEKGGVYLSEKSGAYFLLLLVIGFLGMLICSFIWVTLRQARRQLRNLDCWWYSEDRSKLADKSKWLKLIEDCPDEDSQVKKLPKHPPLQVHKSRPVLEFIMKCVNDYNIPLIFIVGWASILIIVSRYIV